MADHTLDGGFNPSAWPVWRRAAWVSCAMLAGGGAGSGLSFAGVSGSTPDLVVSAGVASIIVYAVLTERCGWRIGRYLYEWLALFSACLAAALLLTSRLS